MDHTSTVQAAPEVLVLGCGPMVPTLRRYPSAYLFRDGHTNILLDCGPLTVARLLEYGIDLQSIDAICVTHFHTDHFAGAFPLVHALWVDARLSGRNAHPLLLVGPETLESRWAKLREVYWPEVNEEYPLRFLEAPRPPLQLGCTTIETFPITHVPWFKSVGFRLKSLGRTVVYPGDVGSSHPFNDLVAQADRADLLIVEAGNVVPTSNHFTAQQIIKLQAAAGVKRTLVTHLREQHIPQIEMELSGRENILLAIDGLTIEL